MSDIEQRRLHQSVSLVGLRAQATAIGLLQLTTELVRAGVLDDAAVGRIKEAIAKDLLLAPPASVKRKDFECWVRTRLDELFACGGSSQVGPQPTVPLDSGINASAA